MDNEDILFLMVVGIMVITLFIILPIAIIKANYNKEQQTAIQEQVIIGQGDYGEVKETYSTGDEQKLPDELKLKEKGNVNPYSINNTTLMEQVIICADTQKHDRGVHIACMAGFKFIVTMHPGHVTTEQILNETGGGILCGE